MSFHQGVCVGAIIDTSISIILKCACYLAKVLWQEIHVDVSEECSLPNGGPEAFYRQS